MSIVEQRTVTTRNVAHQRTDHDSRCNSEREGETERT
jgi:hypothetical protein